MNILNSKLEELKSFATKQIVIEGYDLGRIKGFLDYLGNPQNKFSYIHVTGTSGKGSTVKYACALLAGQGIKCGAYYSPHVVSPLERIEIDNKRINEQQFIKAYEFIKKQHDKFFQGKTGLTITYFEFLLIIAFVVFEWEGLKYVVLEVGLGGKLDPTNIINESVAVITNVGLDHTRLLGNTVEKIAADKMMIVKPNTVCISSVTQHSVISIISEHCKGNGSELLLLDRDFKFKVEMQDKIGSLFNLYYKNKSYKSIKINQAGGHQVRNAVLAIIAVIEFCGRNGIVFDETKLNKSLLNANLPGRFEIKSVNPLIVWDVAHNEDKMRALVDILTNYYSNFKTIRLCLAVKKGQETRRMLKPLSSLSNQIKTVMLTTYRVSQDMIIDSEPPAAYKTILSEYLPNAQINFERDPIKAYKELLSFAQKDDLVLVTGSFYLLNKLVSTVS